MRVTWKLLPLAALFVLGLLLLSPSGSSPTPVSADVQPGDISPEALTVPDGEILRVTFIADDDDPSDDDLQVTATDGATDNERLTIAEDCDYAGTSVNTGDTGCEDTDGDNTDNNIDIPDADAAGIDGDNTADNLTIVVNLYAHCDDPETITLTVLQDGGESDSVDILCLPDPNIIIFKDVTDGDDNDDDGAFIFDFDDGDNPADCWIWLDSDGDGDFDDPRPIADDEHFELRDTGEARFFCAIDVKYEFTELNPIAHPNIVCSDSGSPTVEQDEDEDRLEVTLHEIDESVECTFENEPLTTPTPTATITPTVTSTATVTATATRTPTVQSPSTLTLVASTGTLGCGGSAIVSIRIRDGSGVGVGGIFVGTSASFGSIGAQSTTDSSGQASVTYNAPSNSSGTAVITAGGGGLGGSITIVVSCAPPVTIVAAAPQQPEVIVVSQITPPNTGDAGLARDTWRTYPGIALILASLLGAIAVVRVRR